jgi:hypothetical protein
VGDPADKMAHWACSGCGEFNPLLVFSKNDADAFKSGGNKAERDARNAPNRRASVFLFPATAKGPGSVTFPCPPWSEGTAKCKKQLFSDADKRRNPTETERTWDAAKDTFGCQFYAEIGKGEYSPTKPTHFKEGYDIPIYEKHYSEKVASIVAIHKKTGRCQINIHPNSRSTKPEIQNQRIKVIEAIVRQDENSWLNLVKKATTADVQSLLTFFARKEWPCNPGKIDGIEGHKTWAGIYLFQHSYNEKFGLSLKEDGICGPKTWAAILKVLCYLVEVN